MFELYTHFYGVLFDLVSHIEEGKEFLRLNNLA